MFKLNFRDLASAVISAVLVALVGYLSTVTNITEIDVHQILNIALLTGVTSLLKAFATNDAGKFGGVVKVK